MKVCPILLSGIFGYTGKESVTDKKELILCLEYKCQFWTSAFTTENIEIWDCAFVIMAKKNSDGGIPV
jgi:hypothetical protein